MRTANTQKTSMENLELSYSCPVCKDTGIELIKVDGHEVARDCSCGLLKRQQIENQLKYACIPDNFKDMRLSTFGLNVYKNKTIANTMVKMIKYWLNNLEKMKNDGIGLYLFSDCKGSGKTRMAASIANELMYEQGIPVRFATSIQIINEIKATWDNDGITENKLLNVLSTINVLVIDDFGTETVKDWITDRFYHIVNERYVRKLITIYTSNKALEKLDYDERIKNRILESTLQIPFPEESVRVKIANERQEEMIKAIK